MTYNKQVYNPKVVILKNSYMYIHSTIVLLFIQYHINVLTLKSFTLLDRNHCVKSVQIRITFWSVFSLIRTEYREILRISPYSVRMRENTDQKILRIWTLFTECGRLQINKF